MAPGGMSNPSVIHFHSGNPRQRVGYAVLNVADDIHRLL